MIVTENVRKLLKAHEGLKREVYLDIENSSFVLPEVIEAMLPYFNKRAYVNPTLTHKPGWEAYDAIMESAQTIARYFGCKSIEEINFTPGEAEANNLALLGAVSQMCVKRGKIVISEIEPLSIMHVAEILSKQGFSMIKVSVDGEGFIDLEKLKEAVDDEIVIASFSAVNCEGEALTIELSLNSVYVSSGSACTRHLLQPSHVLVAIGRKFEEAHGSILMKATRIRTEADIDYVFEVLSKVVERLRGITGSMVAE